MNVLKIARYLNLIGGTALIVVCVIEIIGIIPLFFKNPGQVLLNFFLCFFGLVIMASSINMPCVARNFFFILTGVGKGLFNIFVGTLLFLNDDGVNPSMILGFCLIFSGLTFLFLSYCKKMTDTDLQRATSLYANDLQK